MTRVGLLWEHPKRLRALIILGRDTFTVDGTVIPHEPTTVYLKHTDKDTLQHVGLVQKVQARFVGHITHNGRIVQIVAVPNKLKAKPSQPDYILYQNLKD